MTATILTNAALVLRDKVRTGTVVIDGDRIADVQSGRSFALPAVDLEGDYLIPGVVDVHTDNLERQVQPRHSARWPSRSAMLSHDAQCAVAGVTTVLDALCVGDLGFDTERIKTFQDAIVDLDALTHTGLFKSDHYLHLRLEMPAPDVMELFEPVAEHPLARMVSLMDHSPGVGQYADLDRYRELRRKGGMNEAQIEDRIAFLTEQRNRYRTPNRKALLARVAGLNLPLASHDDRIVEEIEENHADGIDISEFPVTLEAAQAARERGMQVIAGAPNIVRGGSHSGNVRVADLVEAGAVDAFASDYVPPSLIEAAFQCSRDSTIALPDAIALITDRPARMTRLTDRGRIEAGLRADLVRVRVHDGLPVVRQVWRAGERVA